MTHGTFAGALRYALAPLRERRFTYQRYDHLLGVLSMCRFLVAPLCDYQKAEVGDRVLVGLRHDVDIDLQSALEMARLEHRRGVRATYFVLHTAPYYGVMRRGVWHRRRGLRRALLEIQDRYGHEVGLHNDLVTLEVVFGVDAVAFVREELRWLRAQGLEILGSAAHGSPYAARFGYDNRYLFSDLCVEQGAPFNDAPHHEQVVTGRGRVRISKVAMADLGLRYEAYHLDHGLNPTDSDLVGGRRWHPDKLDLDALAGGDRMILLTHPLHWGDLATKYRRRLTRFVGNRLARRVAW